MDWVNGVRETPRTRVVNVKSKEAFNVYIGRVNGRYGLRQSKWANPFRIGDAHPIENRPMTRADTIAWYREYALQQPGFVAEVRAELRGKVLGCWCKPSPCHGDVLAELADREG